MKVVAGKDSAVALRLDGEAGGALLANGRGSPDDEAPTIPLTEGKAAYALALFMKVVSSIKSAKKRHPACQVVRRKGRIYVINKVEPRYKARQG